MNTEDKIIKHSNQKLQKGYHKFNLYEKKINKIKIPYIPYKEIGGKNRLDR